MQPKLLKTTVAEYLPAVWEGKNESGWEPVGDRVIILPDVAAEQTTGKIYLDAGTRERATMAADTGLLIALGDAAFAWNSDRTRPYDGRKPKPGERVTFERYAGQLVLGDDGSVYRVCDDKCIAGVRT